ncbi:GIY-YIG nuclease family protein [Atlanticothrix silvestris]|nr:GIY-YIG nuclease family protein [Atlanticothrix silvestris]
MYILECADGSFYTGSTKDLPRRLWRHQNGLGANHIKKRLPVKLVYAEHYDHVADAFYREKQVQGWSRAKKIALMNSDWDRLHILAECQNYSIYCQKIAALNELKQSILQKAFTGELTADTAKTAKQEIAA